MVVLATFAIHISLTHERMSKVASTGLLSEEDLERFRAALTAWAALPDAYTLWLSLMVCGEKPYQD
jgi:hypothetical protein